MPLSHRQSTDGIKGQRKMEASTNKSKQPHKVVETHRFEGMNIAEVDFKHKTCDT